MSGPLPGLTGRSLSRQAGRGLSPDSASVLILALWSLFFLGALALAVGSYVSANLKLAAGLSDDLAGSYLARAAIEQAIAEAVCDTNEWDAFSESWASPALFEEVELETGRYSLLNTQVSPTGEINTNYGLIDEESKIHLGRANLEVLQSLLRIVAGIDAGEARAIAASIIDWRDSDNNVLTDGAESDYYEALDHPYGCHNAEFDSLEELLLVKGMSADILRSTRPHVTVCGAGLVNINTAGYNVLLALAKSVDKGDDATHQLLVQRILRHRAAGGVFRSRADMDEWRTAERIPAREGTVFSSMGAMLDVRSTCLGGTALGWRGEDRYGGGRIAFVYDRRTNMKVYWYEL